MEGGKNPICPKGLRGKKNTLSESFLTSPNPGDWDSLGCSVSSAPGARTKVPLSSSAVCVKGCQRGLAEESTYPPKIHPSLQMFLSSSTSSVVVVIYFFFLPLWRDTSTTSPLITSACHGNFVRQKRNALFWRDDDPLARPKAQLELECYGCGLEKKKGKKRNTRGRNRNKRLVSHWREILGFLLRCSRHIFIFLSSIIRSE